MTDLVKCDLEKLRVALVAAVLADDDLVSILEEVDDDIASEAQQQQQSVTSQMRPSNLEVSTREHFETCPKPW